MVGIILATGARAAEPVTMHGRAMGTTWVVKFVQPARALEPPQVSRAVGERLEQLERQFSSYRPNSEISRFNASETTGWVEVSAELAHLATEARRISELTGGAFDVTVAPLVQLWGFGRQRRTRGVPDEMAIARARSLVDWRRLESRLNPPALRKQDPQLAADFSSIAKGYAVDRISELLRLFGADRHFVQIGGDVKAAGASPGGERGWRTGVEKPNGSTAASDLVCVLELSGQALSTSGDYRNFVMLDDKRFGHIIDPRTGRPADTGLAAVSVVHSSCALSSALATALYVLGPADGLRLAEREKLAALFLVRDGTGVTRRMTRGLEKILRP